MEHYWEPLFDGKKIAEQRLNTLRYQLSSFINSKMACKRVIVILADQLKADDFWYIEKILMMEYFLDVFSVFM